MSDIQFAITAESHRVKERTAGSPAERLHWQLEAERFEQLASIAVTDPTRARALYRPTLAYQPEEGVR